jgi:hypothetical protein
LFQGRIRVSSYLGWEISDPWRFIDGKTMGKPWENPGKSMPKPWNIWENPLRMMINGDKWRFLDGNMINVDFLDIAMFEDTGGYHPDLWPLRGGLNHQHLLIVESLLPFTVLSVCII